METRERSLLAEIIHDEPMQLIVAAAMRIDRLALSTADSTELEEISVLLETSIERLRRLIVALAPPDLAEGLGSALQILAAGIFVGTETKFHITGPMHIHIRVPAKETVYRIFREALVNARKHANAANVTLNLDERDRVFVLTLTDDGDGAVSLDAGPGHLGMATMRVRATSEGGRLRVVSAPGRGTTVRLTMPVQGVGESTDGSAIERGAPLPASQIAGS
jgi:signal transduction histidine kinase